MTTRKRRGGSPDSAGGSNDRHEDAAEGWVCSLCTYHNAKGAGKCEMCDSMKGTATRKPRLSEKVVKIQEQIQSHIIREAEIESKVSPDGHSTSSSHDDKRSSTDSKPPSKRRFVKPPKLKNVDRSSARQFPVTVNGVTVVITDFQPKLRQSRTSIQQLLNKQESASEQNDCASSTVSSPPPPSPCPLNPPMLASSNNKSSNHSTSKQTTSNGS